MDVDALPGSVTHWTVTLADQQRLKRAQFNTLVASPGFWIVGVAIPPIGAGILLWAWVIPSPEPMTFVAVMVASLVVVHAGGLSAVRRRVERGFQVGATFTSWATASGVGVRTPIRLAFYPWSRLTQVDQGPVLVRFGQPVGRWRSVAPVSLLAGPEEHTRSVDFPVQLISPEIARELRMGAGRRTAEPALPGEPVVIDRALHRRLSRGWMRQQMGLILWVLPAVAVLQCTISLIDGSYRMAILWTVLLVLTSVALLRGDDGQISGMYPIGATVVGSVGEYVQIQGPWGSIAWHHGWLRQGRMTEHTVAYEVVQNRPRRGMASLDKRVVVIPRAFLDAPTPAVSTEV
ncbi:hypothetical protein SAMN05428985_102224 [Nocardioides sp. YR527]|uniref:hypothetical protein n=1 Tax=Nocardioides sp. YR527 TaxID=1881028 RepID=UPI00087FFC56|nr:hypothetical protein [Nocardioides sp. YR527]SDK00360.1 hypothetical protein SAMN05428985_102224 [Nocardioides sp. YR527]